MGIINEGKEFLRGCKDILRQELQERQDRKDWAKLAAMNKDAMNRDGITRVRLHCYDVLRHYVDDGDGGNSIRAYLESQGAAASCVLEPEKKEETMKIDSLERVVVEKKTPARRHPTHIYIGGFAFASTLYDIPLEQEQVVISDRVCGKITVQVDVYRCVYLGELLPPREATPFKVDYVHIVKEEPKNA